LIVNSFETRGDNITAMFGTESDFITGTRRLSPIPFAYDFVPAICETPLVDRYSPIPRDISPDELSVDTFPADRLDLGIDCGSSTVGRRSAG